MLIFDDPTQRENSSQYKPATEVAPEHPELSSPTGDQTPERDGTLSALKRGITRHERKTFKRALAEQRPSDVPDKVKSHDPSGGTFLWMTAIEGSTIPQMNVDQMDWTQHYNFWKQDLHRVRVELGVKYLRVSPPWYKLNPGPAIYDWSWWDEYTDYAVGVLGFELIVSLTHFGTPLWMLQQFGDVDFAPRLAEYAGQFARRYRGAIRCYVPVNEPYITALFCGDLGCWPPFRKGQPNFPPMLSNITRGIINASQAIEAEQPDAIFMYVDATENSWSPSASLWRTIEHRNWRRFISYDLALGMVDDKHPLLDWLLKNNMSEGDLQYFRENPAPVDVIGLDYYPHSEAMLRRRGTGYQQKEMLHSRLANRLWDQEHLAPENRRWPIGFYGIAKEYQARYRQSIVLAETNWCGGPIEHRLRWMNFTLAECQRLRAEGFPLIGYCWWGAYDHLDWGLALRLHSGKIHPVGLWNLVRKNWVLQRIRCPLFDRYRYAIHHTEDVVGRFPLRADVLFE